MYLQLHNFGANFQSIINSCNNKFVSFQCETKLPRSISSCFPWIFICNWLTCILFDKIEIDCVRWDTASRRTGSVHVVTVLQISMTISKKWSLPITRTKQRCSSRGFVIHHVSTGKKETQLSCADRFVLECFLFFRDVRDRYSRKLAAIYRNDAYFHQPTKTYLIYIYYFCIRY